MNETLVNIEQEKKPKSNPFSRIAISLLVIIVLLLISNLSITGFLAYKLLQSSGGEIASAIEPLPMELSSEQSRTALFENCRALFNDQDSDNLYALFAPLAQIEIPQEQMDQQLPVLYQITGKINSGTFSHYEFNGISNGRKWFVLYYRVQTDNGLGTLTIMVAQNGQEPYEIWGYHIDIG